LSGLQPGSLYSPRNGELAHPVRRGRAVALDRAAMARPSAFTLTFAFRRCAHCGAVQVVKDDDDCLVCDASLA
jgi:hypothetical protein